MTIAPDADEDVRATAGREAGVTLEIRSFVSSAASWSTSVGLVIDPPRFLLCSMRPLFFFFLHWALGVGQDLLCYQLRDNVVVVHLHPVAAFALRH